MVELKIQYYLILQTKINLYVKYTNKDLKRLKFNIAQFLKYFKSLYRCYTAINSK